MSSTANITDNWYVWGAQLANVYPDGMPYVSFDDGETWDEELDADMTFATYGRDNLPPETPIITGETNGKVGEEYMYCIDTAVDPDGDSIYVYWDWGDGTNSSWLGPYASGEQVCADHIWSEEGIYTIKARLKDDYGGFSEWGYLEVTMPKNKPFNINSFFLRILDKHLNLFPILRNLLKL